MFSEEQRKQMMAYAYRKQEDLKVSFHIHVHLKFFFSFMCLLNLKLSHFTQRKKKFEIMEPSIQYFSVPKACNFDKWSIK